MKKKVIICTIVIVCAIFLVVCKCYRTQRKLSQKEILELRETYILYTNLNQGFKKSLIHGTEKMTEAAFCTMVELLQEKQNFALVKAKITQAPEITGNNRYKLNAECIKLAGAEEIYKEHTLYCSEEYFYNCKEILQEGESFLFLVVDGNIERNKGWYIVEKHNREYVFPIVSTEAMERYEGVLRKEIEKIFLSGG